MKHSTIADKAYQLRQQSITLAEIASDPNISLAAKGLYLALIAYGDSMTNTIAKEMCPDIDEYITLVIDELLESKYCVPRESKR